MEILGYTLQEFTHRWNIGWFKSDKYLDIITDFLNHEWVTNETCSDCIGLERELNDLEEAYEELEDTIYQLDTEIINLNTEIDRLTSKIYDLELEIFRSKQ